MIKRDVVSIESKSGNIIDNMFLSHSEGTKNIAIIFPGGDNLTDIPTLHYARKAALLCDCDVLSIKYGYNNFNEESNMNIVIEECYNLIAKCLNKDYSNVFFISKSIGNTISFRVSEMLEDRSIKYISYTPISENVIDLATKQCIVFTGTNDKWISKKDIEELMNKSNVQLMQIENAVHSLEIDDNYEESIEILKRVTEKCADFIRRNITT